jgi:RNA polymerase sigma-54 factor
MKQSLQLKIGQQLTMTPQLQQAIRLLQLSSLDLQQEIQDALDSNFMLEVDDNQNNQSNSNEENTYTDPISADANPNNLDDPVSTNANEPQAEIETSNLENVQVDFEDIQNTIPEELPTDANWDEVFENNTIHSTSGSTQLSGADSNFIDNLFQNNGKLDDNIQEHLTKQLDLISLSDQDRNIAEVIIDSIDDNGYLNAEIDDLLENFPHQDDIEKEEIEAVLHLIQSFDPAGVATRDLRENLLVQLHLLNTDTLWLNEAITLVDRHLHLLGNREFTSLKRRMKLSEENLIDVIKLIQSLNPRPAGQISDQKPQYVVPDVIVKKYKGIWHAELNNDSIPPLTINKEYMELSKEVKNKQDPLNTDFSEEIPTDMSTKIALSWLFFGILILVGSSKILIWGAVNIAQSFGVSDLVIGLTIIAIGTSLPELAASIASALKGEHEIAIGNIIGSNMFNLLGVLGIPALISPISELSETVLSRDYPVMIGLSILLLVFAYGFTFGKKSESEQTHGRINRLESMVLLFAYIAYMYFIYLTIKT